MRRSPDRAAAAHARGKLHRRCTAARSTQSSSPPRPMLISFCGDEKRLRPGIVLIADLGEDFVRQPAGALPVARHAGRGDGRLAVDQRRFGPAIARLRDVVELGMDLDVARRHGALAIGKEIDRPVVLRDAVLLARAPRRKSGLSAAFHSAIRAESARLASSRRSSWTAMMRA